MDVSTETAEGAFTGINNIAGEARPDEITLRFAIKLTADAGVVFAKAGTEERLRFH